MMQTHRDRDHEPDPPSEEMADALNRLQEEAEVMRKRNLSTITAGEEGEEPIREWKSNGVLVRQLPERETDERLDLSRISIGSIPGGMAYVVFRGPLAEVKLALKRARNALRQET